MSDRKTFAGLNDPEDELVIRGPLDDESRAAPDARRRRDRDQPVTHHVQPA